MTEEQNAAKAKVEEAARAMNKLIDAASKLGLSVRGVVDATGMHVEINAYERGGGAEPAAGA